MAHGDPATQEWREATQAALAASQADLTRVEQQNEHLRGDFTRTRRERDELRERLTRVERDHAEAVETCGELAKELTAVSHRLTLAQQSRMYVARGPSGNCALCGGPIVRGQAVEARHDGTTKPQWAHVHCPDKEN